MLRFCLTAVIVVGFTANTFADDPPPWSAIKQTVTKYFEAKPNYLPGDLLTRGDIQPLLEQLKDMNFMPEQIVTGFDPFVPENHALAQWLKAAENRPLMRKIAALPNGFDRLDRLSWFPAGQALLKKAFSERDPVKAIETLLSDASAAELEQRFKGEPLAANFATGTGRVYTQAKLIEYLRTAQILERQNLSLPGR